MMNSIIKNKNSYLLLGILFIFLGWFIGSTIVDNNYVIPSIDLTLKALGKLLGDNNTYIILLSTLLRVIVVIVACFIMGLIIGILSFCSSRFEYFVKPIIILFKSLPLAVIIVLVLLMFSENLAVFYIVSVVVFPVMYEATLGGLKGINKDIIEDVKLISNVNLKVIWLIYIRLALPNIITGIIQSFGLGLKVLIMAEYISLPKNSIGREIVYYKDIAVDMSYVYAWCFILIVLILLVELLIAKFSKKISFV